LCAGCGAEPRRDAGEDAGPDDAGFEPPAPEPPASPVLTPCPKGWREVADADGAATCDPYPEGGAKACGADEAHFPGEPACTRIGRPCPVGDFPEDLPAGSTAIYVRPGAVGGDGREASPYGSIAEALADATDGAIVALAKGTYDEVVTLARPVTLRGACVAETIVTSSVPSDFDATITIAFRGGARLEDLTVSGERTAVRVSGDAVAAEMESVLVDGAAVIAVEVGAGASLAAHSIVVRGTRSSSRRDFGSALEVFGAAHATVSRAIFEDNRTVGLLSAEPGSDLEAMDVVVRRTSTSEGALDFGFGIQVQGGARAVVSRALFEGNHSAGMNSALPGSELFATDVIVRGTEAREQDDEAGYGLEVFAGARAEVSRAVLDGNRATGAVALDEETEIVLSDVVVRDTRARLRDGDAGYGIDVQDGAHGDVSRALLARCGATALLALGAGANLVAEDVTVRDTLGRESDRAGGYGVTVENAALLTLTRARVDGSRGVGIVASGVGATAELADVDVVGTLEQECAALGTCNGFGTGLAALDTGTLDVTRFRSSDAVMCGVQVAAFGQADLHVGVISGNAIGANLQFEGFDPRRLQDGVIYRDNEVTFDTSALPVPEVQQGF